MKKVKLSTILFYEAILFLILFIFLNNWLFSYERIGYEKIEVYPIVYFSNNEKCEIKILENEIQIAKKELEEKLIEKNITSNKKNWFISYKNLINNNSELLEPPKNIYKYYTDEEIYLVQRVVETECFDGDFDSKCNVASVIFNRLEHEEFSNDISKVITTPNQFSYWRTEISEDTILAVEYAFEIEDTTGGCIAFHSNSGTGKFNNWDYCFTDKIGHHFYK